MRQGGRQQRERMLIHAFGAVGNQFERGHFLRGGQTGKQPQAQKGRRCGKQFHGMVSDILRDGFRRPARRADDGSVIIHGVKQRIQPAYMIKQQKIQRDPCRTGHGEAGKKGGKIVQYGLGKARTA